MLVTIAVVADSSNFESATWPEQELNYMRTNRRGKDLFFAMPESVVSGFAVLSLAVLSLAVLTGCGLHDEKISPNSNNVQAVQSVNVLSKVRMKSSDKNKVEALSAVSYDGTHFTASVISYGCTHSSHFSVKHETMEGSCKVTIERTKPDLCRRAPMLAEVLVEWTTPADCAELELVVANPVLVTTGDGRLNKKSR